MEHNDRRAFIRGEISRASSIWNTRLAFRLICAGLTRPCTRCTRGRFGSTRIFDRRRIECVLSTQLATGQRGISVVFDM